MGLSNGVGMLGFAYDAAGRETERRLGEGAVLRQEWDAADRLTAQTVTGDAHRILQHRTYAYRPDGYITEIRDLTTGTRRFDLDPVGRVTAVRANGWRERYAYDGAGNVTRAEAPGHPDPGEREFDGTLIRRSGRTRYEHDAQGRLVRKTVALLNGQKREWTFTWNAEDRLTLATNPAGETWAYAYDALGRRTAKWRLDADGSPVERTGFTWDGTRLAEEVTADGAAATWDYAPGTHRVVAQTSHHAGTGTLVDRLTTPPGASRFHAVITDGVGTPMELIAPDGTVAWQARTTLWGTDLPAAADATINCPLRFPGQYADRETGLRYNCFRYYDPDFACYCGPDPLGLTPADNHHGFVVNPWSWIDSEGLTPCPVWKTEFDKLPLGKQGHVRKVVDAKQLRSAFERWTSGGERHAARGPKVPEVYKMPDGTVMQWRLSSKSGGEAIDIVPVTGKALKVHLDEQK